MIDNYRKVFVDTNILVYAHDTSSGDKHTISKKMILDLWKSQKGCISTQILQEFYVTITRKVKNPLDKNIASALIYDLGKWTIHRPDIDDILNAITIQEKYKLSIWDSLIINSALYTKCDILLSEDLNNNQLYEGIKLINPFI